MKRARRGIATLLSAAVLITMMATPAMAEQYRDDQYSDEDSNPLRVVQYVLYPVGKFLELTVFRPLQAVGQHIAPTHDFDPGTPRRCESERPGRHCVATAHGARDY